MPVLLPLPYTPLCVLPLRTTPRYNTARHCLCVARALLRADGAAVVKPARRRLCKLLALLQALFPSPGRQQFRLPMAYDFQRTAI